MSASVTEPDATIIQALGEWALMLPVEIRRVPGGSLVRHTVLRAVRGKLGQLGNGEWLLTVLLPSGASLSQSMKSEADADSEWTAFLSELAGAATKTIG